VALVERIMDISRERAPMQESARILMVAERQRIIEINA
jgi:hypothetical protein